MLRNDPVHPRAEPRGERGAWAFVYRAGLWILAAVAVAGVASLFIPKIRRVNELWERRTRLEAESAQWRAKTQEFRLRQERFLNDPEYVERIAKESGRVRTNEIVFKMEPSPTGHSDKTP